MNKRGFEIVSKYRNDNVSLPRRATEGSAGYDLMAAEDTLIPSIWQVITFGNGVTSLVDSHQLSEENEEFLGSTLVSTGVKVYMPKDEYLLLANRSSNPMKKQLMLPNGIGVIDSDYYNNQKNEGEIFVQLINYGMKDVLIKKGERIAQGIFTPYFRTEESNHTFQKRTGGFGSSGN